MDKRLLCIIVLVALCAATVKAADNYDWYEESNIDNMYDEDDGKNILDKDAEDPLRDAEQKGNDNIYVKPEDDFENAADDFPWAKDLAAAFDEIGESVQMRENFDAGVELWPDLKVNNDEEEIPSDYGFMDSVLGNDGAVEEQDDDNDDDRMQINNSKVVEQTSSEEVIRDEASINSDESANKIFEAIQQALAENTDKLNANLDDDYQVEDNRSQEENKFDDANNDGEENIPDIDEHLAEMEQPSDVLKSSMENHGLDETKVDVPIENNPEILDNNDRDETQEDVNQEERQNFDVDYDQDNAEENKFMDDDLDDDSNSEPVIDDQSNERKEENIENTYQDNSEENKDSFEETKGMSEEREMIEKSFVDETVNSEEDTVNKVYEDLKEDLNELFGTLDKLTDNDSEQNSEEEESAENNDEESNENKSAFVGDDDVKSLIPENKSREENLSDESNQDFVDSGEKRILQMRQDYYDSMKDYAEEEDKNNDIVEEPEPIEAINAQLSENEQEEQHVRDEEVRGSDNNEEFSDEAENEDSVEGEQLPSLYDSPVQKNSEEIDETLRQIFTDNSNRASEEDRENDKIEDVKPNESEEIVKDEIDVLTSAEINNRMTQFALDHADDLDTNSKDFDRNVAPVYITLKVGEPVVIESPNYPEAYPANNIVDWIIDGEGTGIEMNITDLAVNGILGDYLLVKPGGIDESGSDGLIFSYQLRRERRYRFLDVNRVFVRFQSQPGMSLVGNRGFRMSLQLLMPLPEAQVPIPEPEPVILPPQHTLQVFLAGLTPRQFTNQSEYFRTIVADMATLYLNYMEFETDANATEVAQVTQVATCNVNWPGFELCAGVSFGVPLADDEESGLTEEQLHHMWTSYVGQDPFAARLRRMGVTEFAIPNDRTTLIVWLVIGFGVAISAGMLALALWRWSCFEEYTRMPAFSDTDSVISDRKRDLDLYPTPHQTLPPLYDDDFIKYEDTARVDMGGFANKSYVREGNLFDLESDDDLGDLPVKRDRSSDIQPKDIYQV